MNNICMSQSIVYHGMVSCLTQYDNSSVAPDTIVLLVGRKRDGSHQQRIATIVGGVTNGKGIGKIPHDSRSRSFTQHYLWLLGRWRICLSFLRCRWLVVEVASHWLSTCRKLESRTVEPADVIGRTEESRVGKECVS